MFEKEPTGTGSVPSRFSEHRNEWNQQIIQLGHRLETRTEGVATGNIIFVGSLLRMHYGWLPLSPLSACIALPMTQEH